MATINQMMNLGMQLYHGFASPPDLASVVRKKNGVTNANALDSTLVDVYTTAGVKVKHQVEMGKALNDLPAGLYIINNKKIVKK